MQENNGKKKRHVIYHAAIILVLLLVLGQATGVFAWFQARAEKHNQFVQGRVEIEVLEDFTGLLKENVRIKNTGNVPIFVRMAVLINRENDGVLSGTAVDPDSYSLELALSDGWFKVGDYYYFRYPVDPDKESAVLITKLSQTTANEKYALVADIPGSGIQAAGGAVSDVWPVTYLEASNEIEAPETP